MCVCAKENDKAEREKVLMLREVGYFLEWRPQTCWKGWIQSPNSRWCLGLVAGGEAGSRGTEREDW